MKYLKKKQTGILKGILDITDEPLVSVDFNTNEHSAIVDVYQQWSLVLQK